jgi:S-adenosylmethionine synthetase
MQQKYFFTSESVSSGHPDKICDQISDGILDLYLAQDKEARVAIEVMATKAKLIISGEVNTKAVIESVEIESLVREIIRQIGYVSGSFSADTVAIEILLNRQSPEIALGVDGTAEHEEGAGDQGIMFGYACIDGEDYMPAAICYAHKILRNIFTQLEGQELRKFGPDAKSQVTIEYQDGKAKRVDTILLSIQHSPEVGQDEIKQFMKPIIINSFPEGFCDESTKFLFNPTGKFTIGGPEGDVGLTGRKIIIDTYGGSAPHGGGAFSGKDPTKVDRSAAYMARYMAKNIVASGVAEKCLIQLSYAIGVAQPISVFLDCFGTAKLAESEIISFLRNELDLSPRGIRTRLKLNRPIYRKTAIYGHFGRNPEDYPDFTWEQLDLVSKLKML